MLKEFAPSTIHHRRYRVDATILFCGVHLLTRRNVGGAYASVEAAQQVDSRATALQFAAGSWPERARGLNRFGVWREAIVEREGHPPNLAFGGLMTKSREENFEQAKNALTAAAPYAEAIMARGESRNGALRTWVESIDLPAGSNWSTLSATLDGAMRRAPRAEERMLDAGACVSFLCAMREAALSPGPFRKQFVHGGKLYWLETRRRAEHKNDLEGTVRNHDGARCSDFRTSYLDDDATGIPTRIEYRAKSFLRLSFEEESTAGAPSIPSVFARG